MSSVNMQKKFSFSDYKFPFPYGLRNMSRLRNIFAYYWMTSTLLYKFIIPILVNISRIKFYKWN